MNRVGRATVMLGLGVITARLLWSGGFGWFVQQHMRIPLILATIVLLVFGIYELIWRSDSTSSRLSAGPVVGWLLVLPLLVLISVAPTGLGAAAADRVEAFTPNENTAGFTPLDDSDGPIEMRMFDFLDRAAWDTELSLEGRTIRLQGLVVNHEDVPDGFKLTRFMVSCCAADGIPLQVTLRNVGTTYADDTWVIADVIWRPPTVPYQNSTGSWIIEADAVSITVDPDPPDDPYESPY